MKGSVEASGGRQQSIPPCFYVQSLTVHSPKVTIICVDLHIGFVAIGAELVSGREHHFAVQGFQ